VFINSHLLSELEVVSDRVAILVGGRVARQGTIDELTVAKQRYEIEISPNGQTAPAHEILGALRDVFPDGAASAPVSRGKLPTGEWAELRGPVLSVGATDPAQIQPLLDRLRQANLTIRRVQPVRPSLEDLFMEAVDTDRAANGRATA
jgi:ABC-2 type transport system ATP-binding protein